MAYSHFIWQAVFFVSLQQAAVTPLSNAPDGWSMMPLRSTELSSLIAKSELVARAKVVQHWPAQFDGKTHTETAEHTTLIIDKLFRNKGVAVRNIDLVCVCSRESNSGNLTPGTEIIIFARYDRQDRIWQSAGQIYYLLDSSWLERQISTRKR